MMFYQIFGTVNPPYEGTYGGLSGGRIGPNFGLLLFLNNALRLIFVVGGLLFFFNLVFAGFQFLNAGGDPKAIEQAWNKILQSIIGLLIIVISFVIAAVIGVLMFGNASALLNVKIYGPD